MAYAFDRVNSYIDRNKKENEVQKEDALRRSTLAPAPSQNISRQDKSANLSPQFQNMPAATPPQQAVPGRARYSRAQANQAATKAAKAGAGSRLPGFIGDLGATATENKKKLDAVKGSYLDQQREASTERYSVPAQDVGDVVGGKGETPEEEQQRQEKKDIIRGVLQGRSGGPEDLKLPNIKRDIYGQDLSKKENVRRLLRQGKERYTPGMASLDLDVLSSVPEFTTAASKLSAQQDELLDYYNELSRELPSEASSIDAQIYDEYVTGEGGLSDRLRGRRTDLVGEQQTEAKELAALLKDLKTPSTGKGAEAKSLINAQLVKKHLAHTKNITGDDLRSISQKMINYGDQWLKHVKMTDPHTGKETTLEQFLDDAELKFGQDFNVDVESMADEGERFTFNELNNLLGPGDVDETAKKSLWKKEQGKKYYDMDDSIDGELIGRIDDRKILNQAIQERADEVGEEVRNSRDYKTLEKLKKMNDKDLLAALMKGEGGYELRNQIMRTIGKASKGESHDASGRSRGVLSALEDMWASQYREPKYWRSESGTEDAASEQKNKKSGEAMVSVMRYMRERAKFLGLKELVDKMSHWNGVWGSANAGLVYRPGSASAWRMHREGLKNFNDAVKDSPQLEDQWEQLIGAITGDYASREGHDHGEWSSGPSKREENNKKWSDVFGAGGSTKRDAHLVKERGQEFKNHWNESKYTDEIRSKLRSAIKNMVDSGNYIDYDFSSHGRHDSLLKNIGQESKYKQIKQELYPQNKDKWDYSRLLDSILQHQYISGGGWVVPKGYKDRIPHH